MDTPTTPGDVRYLIPTVRSYILAEAARLAEAAGAAPTEAAREWLRATALSLIENVDAACPLVRVVPTGPDERGDYRRA